jgi:polar amino acid transport system substrate-binding protein
MLHAMRATFVRSLFALCALLPAVPAAARDLRVSLPEIKNVCEQVEHCVFVDLVRALERVSGSDHFIVSGIFPYARSVQNLVSGQADMHFPVQINPLVAADRLPYRISSEPLHDTEFVLYRRKDRPDVTPESARRFTIATGRGLIEYFDFPVQAVDNIGAGLRMVDAGRLDGLVYTFRAADAEVRRLNLKNLYRAAWARYSVRIALPLGQAGAELDRTLTPLIRQLKASGEYDRVMAPLIGQKYSDWQMPD